MLNGPLSDGQVLIGNRLTNDGFSRFADGFETSSNDQKPSWFIQEFSQRLGCGSAIRSQNLKSSFTEPPEIFRRMPADKAVPDIIADSQLVPDMHDRHADRVIFGLNQLQ